MDQANQDAYEQVRDEIAGHVRYCRRGCDAVSSKTWEGSETVVIVGCDAMAGLAQALQDANVPVAYPRQITVIDQRPERGPVS